jgi:hypothetical protein
MATKKSYGTDFQGEIKIESVATLPEWNASDERRLVYDAENDKFWGATDSGWESLTLENDTVSPGAYKYYGTDVDEIKGYQDLNSLPDDIGIGGSPGSSVPSLRRCTINSSTGAITLGDGVDLMLNSNDDNNPDQQFKAYKIWNAVWNDIADFQPLDDELVYGKCYYDASNGAKICNERCQMSVIGVASNTFGYGLGAGDKKVPIAVAGWVLAFVDKEYKMGTPLTNDENGDLTEMSMEEKRLWPERIVAIYKKKETKLSIDDKVSVDNRHWVKVK